jgi:hypothetical protein
VIEASRGAVLAAPIINHFIVFKKGLKSSFTFIDPATFNRTARLTKRADQVPYQRDTLLDREFRRPLGQMGNMLVHPARVEHRERVVAEKSHNARIPPTKKATWPQRLQKNHSRGGGRACAMLCSSTDA